jgi:uncharacterized protein
LDTVLLELADLSDEGVAPAGSWRRRAAERLVGTLDSRTDRYPCIFGVDALRKGGLRFAFIDDAEGEEGIRTLAAALREFVSVFPALPKRSSLITFLDVPPGQEVDGYQEVFWRTLSRLRALDDRPWPQDIAPDPEDPWWEFCFAGEPMFVVCATAAHSGRRSRSAENMMITFQPRPVFDGLETGTPAGERARKVIRGRLETYDAVPAHTALGPYGDPDHREWRQYFLPDADVGSPARCPLTGATAGGTT